MERLQGLVRRYAPRPVRRFMRARRGLDGPPIGSVRFGDLRRTTPISPDFGFARGGPVDRYYIESFLDRNRRDIRGRCLEVGDASYTLRYGGDRVAQADVLHLDPTAPGVTFVGDLAEGSFLPDDAFDCIVLTQMLHMLYDFRAGLATVRRVLAPGGVLLMTVPGITNVDPGEWGSVWHYSFTHQSVNRMCSEAFDGFEIQHSSYGNVLAAIAFLHGLGAGELATAELDDHHIEYSLIHAVRVVKDR